MSKLSRESLCLDIEQELNNTNFNDVSDVDSSYHYILTKIKECDFSLNYKSILIDILEDNNITLQETYFELLDRLRY